MWGIWKKSGLVNDPSPMLEILEVLSLVDLKNHKYEGVPFSLWNIKNNVFVWWASVINRKGSFGKERIQNWINRLNCIPMPPFQIVYFCVELGNIHITLVIKLSLCMFTVNKEFVSNNWSISLSAETNAVLTDKALPSAMWIPLMVFIVNMLTILLFALDTWYSHLTSLSSLLLC